MQVVVVVVSQLASVSDTHILPHLLAWNGKVPTLYAMPASLASSSVLQQPQPQPQHITAQQGAYDKAQARRGIATR